MRTLDIGGDKDLPYFPINEVNPALGWRGIRITLDHPEIFLVQMRAMLKASIGLQQPADHAAHGVFGLRDRGGPAPDPPRPDRSPGRRKAEIPMPKLGIMIEVPAVLLQIRDLANHRRFRVRWFQ
jgi:phosphotransferase system enzyme I (PtsP)